MLNDSNYSETSKIEPYICVVTTILVVVGIVFAGRSVLQEDKADRQNCSGAIVKYYYAPNHNKIIHCLTVENGVEKIEVKQYQY